MTVSEGAAGEGVEVTGALTLSECRELCRVVTTCTTATWTNNICTIHKRNKNKKGNGTKVIFLKIQAVKVLVLMLEEWHCDTRTAVYNNNHNNL